MTSLVGTATLLRLAWRRDRWILVVSVALLVLTAYASMAATLDLYPTDVQAAGAAAIMEATPSLAAFYGPIPAPTSAGIGVLKTVMMGGVFTAILGFALVRRHTRTEEEEGRHELLAAGVIGRRAPLLAAVLLAVGAVLATAALSAAALIGLGVSPSGSLALGASELIAGLVMIGVTALTVQLTSTTRGAGGIALAVLAVAFVLRAIGDTTTGWCAALSWCSFLGWAQKVAPFGANRFWLLGPALATTLVLLLAADWLLRRRDLGAGVWAPRPGPARAAATLATPLGLAWRLHRGALLEWSIGYAVLGAVVGSMAGSVNEMMADPAIADMLRTLGGGEGTLLNIFFSTEIRFMAFGTAAYAITTMLRLHTEEAGGRAEAVLTSAVSRWRWLASHTTIAALGSVWLSLVMGVFAGAAAGRVSRTGIADLVPAALATLPAVAVCLALTLAIFGRAPHWSLAAWSLLIAFLVLAEFGVLLDFPPWLVGLSPFDHLGSLPGGSARGGSLLILTLLATLIGYAGSLAFRRRDVGT